LTYACITFIKNAPSAFYAIQRTRMASRRRVGCAWQAKAKKARVIARAMVIIQGNVDQSATPIARSQLYGF
jgi:hypothetical protein